MEETYLKNNYQRYKWSVHNNGDIWAEQYRPYTFQEWIEEGCPEDGGIEVKKITRR